MMASASISTSISGLIRRLTSTMLVAGRTSANLAMRASDLFHRSMSVT